MPDRTTNRRDRRFFAVTAGFLAFGGLCVGAGAWRVMHPSTDLWITRAWPGAGIVCGVIFIGFATAELVRRLRRGPQEPGRHMN